MGGLGPGLWSGEKGIAPMPFSTCKWQLKEGLYIGAMTQLYQRKPAKERRTDETKQITRIQFIKKKAEMP